MQESQQEVTKVIALVNKRGRSLQTVSRPLNERQCVDACQEKTKVDPHANRKGTHHYENTPMHID